MRFDMVLINTAFAFISGALVLLSLKLFDVNFERRKVILFLLIFGAVNGLLSTKITSLSLIVNSIKPIILMVLSVAIIKFLLNINLSSSVISFLFVMIGTAVGNSIAPLLIGIWIKDNLTKIVSQNAVLYLIANVITAIIASVFILLLKLLAKFIRIIKFNKELTFALMFTFIIMTANGAIQYTVKEYDPIVFVVIFLMSIIYGSYLVYNSTMIYKKVREKEEKEQQDFYNRSLENTLFNLRRFKHDWNNNLAVLTSLLTMKRTEEALSYLREMVEYSSSINTSMFNIKNAGLYGIISAKQQLAQSKGLDIIISGVGEISNIPKIKVSELCEIMGIILDNAIEESEKVNENIEFNFMDTDKTIEFSISNKCKNDVDLRNMISIKGEERGNGLRIIDQIISKYKNIHNYRSYNADVKTFEQVIIIEKGL